MKRFTGPTLRLKEQWNVLLMEDLLKREFWQSCRRESEGETGCENTARL